MNRLSLFLDISGIIARETDSQSSYTVGGVVVATADVEKARTAIKAVGKKWRDIDNSSAVAMAEAILTHSMTLSATQVRKSQPAWEKFWSDGERFHGFMASVEKSAVGFVKSSNVIRYAAFRDGSAHSIGYCLKCHGLPSIVAPNGFSPLELHVVCDTDIQGQENIETFCYVWSEYEKHSKTKRVFRVEHKIQAVDFKTEQDEPLLLPPDFIAGCFQWYLGRPEVPLPKHLEESYAESIAEELRQSHNFNLTQTDFRLTYEDVFGDLLNQKKP
jgi:hypothetical protein